MLGLGLLTLVVRRCGTCNRILGVAVWRWSGRLWVETHGYCDDCFARLGDEIRESEHRRAGDGGVARRRSRRRPKTVGTCRSRLSAANDGTPPRG
jgi:hypothetical protein